ncbi:MAG: AmmeMemoRadiSam system radical SAM enzyme [Candidatus Edwardsbacteria bacterium]
MIKEAILYERLKDAKVRCHVCQRRCIISPNKFGYCYTRQNIEGKLYTLIYGEVSTWHIAPIEIKPLFHFYPGSKALSFGSLGCNFRCLGCQNWEIAHVKQIPNPKSKSSTINYQLSTTNPEYISPSKAVELARKHNCQGLSWTYNEPTIWLEYTLDTMILAKTQNFYTNYVTNGYITEEALDLIGPHLDAFRLDVKGFSDEFYEKIANIPNFRVILKTAERAKHKWKMHMEVITNVIPGYNDDENQLKGIAGWIFENLGKETPWHVTRFVPHLKLSYIPSTPVEILEKAREIGIKAGLEFIYLGNVPGHPAENTYCPKCKNLLIERFNYQILKYQNKNGKCAYCGRKIPIVGQYADEKQKPLKTKSLNYS